MNDSTTVVTAGDANFAWGACLLVASMRMNGMKQPVLVGATGWNDEMKSRVESLGGVTIKDLPPSRQCVACQKPLLMTASEIKTDWVCWADADGAFVGDCSEWLTPPDPDEIVIRCYNPCPPDFTPQNLEIWRRDVERFRGRAVPTSRYSTRMNTAFIVINRKWIRFLSDWGDQIRKVLPEDVEIIMKHGTAYFQTDESVISSLLCFAPDAPKVTQNYKANGSADRSRYFAHFAYNPKPWQMWNPNSLRWHGVVMPIVNWLVENGYVKGSELPPSLRMRWWPFWRTIAPAAPWMWRAIKLKRRIIRK